MPIRVDCQEEARLGFHELVCVCPAVNCQFSEAEARSHGLLDTRRHQPKQLPPDYLFWNNPSCGDIAFQCGAFGSLAEGCHILTVGGHCLGKPAKPRAVCLLATSFGAASKKAEERRKEGPLIHSDSTPVPRQNTGPAVAAGRGCSGSGGHSPPSSCPHSFSCLGLTSQCMKAVQGEAHQLWNETDLDVRPSTATLSMLFSLSELVSFLGPP